MMDWKAALLGKDQWFLFSVRFGRVNNRRQYCSTRFMVEGNNLSLSAVKQIQISIFSNASSLKQPKSLSLQTCLVLSVTASVNYH